MAMIIYIYLLNNCTTLSFQSALEAEHKVRVAFGNGLRKDIWLEVDKRFKIPLIAEFFSSTEGTGMTVNFFNKPGAVGRLSPLLVSAHAHTHTHALARTHTFNLFRNG